MSIFIQLKVDAAPLQRQIESILVVNFVVRQLMALGYGPENQELLAHYTTVESI